MAELTLIGLRVVLEVGRTGSFSAAAERLGYTQSAISRQIAATESMVGSALFERHARGVRPTAAGEVLIRHAGRVLDDVTAAGQELAGLQDRLAGRLVVGAFPTAAADLASARDRAVAGRPPRGAGAAERSVHAGATAGPPSRATRGGRAGDGTRLPSYDLSGLRLTELRSTRGPESPWPTPTRSPPVTRSPPTNSSTSSGSSGRRRRRTRIRCLAGYRAAAHRVHGAELADPPGPGRRGPRDRARARLGRVHDATRRALDTHPRPRPAAQDAARPRVAAPSATAAAMVAGAPEEIEIRLTAVHE